MNFKFRLGQSGMSLVEVLVAAGMLGGVSLGVSKLMQNMSEGQSQVEAKDDLRTLSQMASSVLANSGNCKATMDNFINTAATATQAGTQSGVQVNFLLREPSTQVYRINDQFGKLNIKDMRLRKYDGGTQKAEFVVAGTFRKSANQVMERERSFPINIDINPTTGEVIQCTSASAGEGDLWTKMAIPAMGIFYNQGSVLVGTGDVDNGTTVPSIGMGTNNTVMAGNSFATGTNNTIDMNSTNAAAIGQANTVKGPNGIAIGLNNIAGATAADGARTVAIGDENQALKTHTLAFGFRNVVNQVEAISIGNRTGNTGLNAVLIGNDSTTNQANSLIFGNTIANSASRAVSIGNNHLINAAASRSINVGDDVKIGGADAIAIGNTTMVGLNSPNAIAIGNTAKVVTQTSNSVAIGFNSTAGQSPATYANAVAIGTNSSARQTGAIGIGFGADVGASSGIAIGTSSVSGGANSVAIGTSSYTLFGANVAIGNNSRSTSSDGVAIGNGSQAIQTYSVAVGSTALANGAETSIAIGRNVTASGSYGSIAIGKDTTTSGSESIGMGYLTESTALRTVSLGPRSTATAQGAIALGNSADATAMGAMSLGENSSAGGQFSVSIGPQVSHSVPYSTSISTWNGSPPTMSNTLMVAFQNGMEICTSGSHSNSPCPASQLYEIRSAHVGWQTPSDRNLKKDFKEIDTEEILEKLSELGITTWNYKTDTKKDMRKIGPMAQDFYRLFTKPLQLSNDDKTLSTNQLLMVTTAATQGLHKKVKSLEEENAELKRELASLKEAVCEINPKAKSCNK